MAELTTENFKDEFQRLLEAYTALARRKKDFVNAAIREAYGPVYLDFFPLDTLRGLHCDDATKSAILTRLKDNFMQNDGDFAYAILEASREMQAAGAKFDVSYCTRLELVVADMWRKMGAQAERKSLSAEILIDEKYTQSVEAIKALDLNDERIRELAKNPKKLHRAASVLFPELSIAMDKMAAISGEAPHNVIGERIRKGLLLPAHAASPIKS